MRWVTGNVSHMHDYKLTNGESQQAFSENI